jgi:hypothetical protein
MPNSEEKVEDSGLAGAGAFSCLEWWDVPCL